MAKITPLQDKTIQRLAHIDEKGETETIFDEIDTLEQKIESIDKNLTEAVNEAISIAQKHTAFVPRKGVDYFDGKDYVLTEADKEEIAKKITPPVFEKETKIIEKTEIIREIPTVTEITNNVENSLTPYEIRDKLELLYGNDRLDMEAIKGLLDEIAKLWEAVRKKGSAQYTGILGIKDITAGTGVSIDKTNQQYPVISASATGLTILTTASTVNDSNRAFVFTEKPTEIVVNNGSYIENSGWTWNAGTLTATLDINNPGPVGTGGKIYGRK